MKRVLGGVLVGALLVLIGVGGVTWLGGLATTSNTTGSGSSSTGGPRPTGGGTDRNEPPPPPRTVNVAGVRLDGTAPDNSCKVVTNPEASLSVRIVGVRFHHDGDQLVQESSHCPDSINDQPVSDRFCKAGTSLPPSAAYADGCRIGAVPRVPGGPWNQQPARVELTLAVSCSSRDAAPCDQIDPQHMPSRERPIDVHWTQTIELRLNPGDYLEPEPTS
jgi:hypothetical protein